MEVAWSAGVLNLASLCIAYACCRVLLPRVIAEAHRRGLMDFPGERRIHTYPVPRLGGVAIIMSTAVTLTITTGIGRYLGDRQPALVPLGALLPTVLIGCGLVFAVGVADDLMGVSPRVKLLTQCVATIIVIVGGFMPQTIGMAPGGAVFRLDSALAIAFTVLWVVGVTNAFNLIDGIDGLAGTMALVAISTCLMSDFIVASGNTFTFSLAFAGALLAFLRYNWHPAKVFLGDSGSMTLGFFLAIRTVVAATDRQGVTYPVVPLVALAYPLVDTVVAMARRWVRRHPLSRADGRHVHHQLLALGFAPPRAVLLLAALFTVVAVLGVGIVFAPLRLAAAMALAGGVVLFAVAAYGVRWLGYLEFLEVGASIASVVRNARVVVNEKLRSAEIAEVIRRADTLEEVRELLAVLAAETRLLDVELLELEGGERRQGPPSQQLSPSGALPMRLEYPFVWQGPDGARDMVLRVWSARHGAGAHPVAERVANRVGPALDDWFRRHAVDRQSKAGGGGLSRRG